MARVNNSPYKFHGAFSEERKAKEKAQKVGGKVKEISVNGKPRFTVYTHNK